MCVTYSFIRSHKVAKLSVSSSKINRVTRVFILNFILKLANSFNLPSNKSIGHSIEIT